MTRILKIAKRILIWFFILSAGSVILLRFVPVYFTPLMGIRCAQQAFSGEKLKLKHKWIPLEEMSPKMPMAVIASEDNRFPDHHGFDLIEINKAIKERERGRHRGASTISQQTAKNVFLWPSSSWIRKGFEAYFTVLIELFWSKERIMEVYLNSIEMGDGIYGVEAVAHEHFGKKASELTAGECALIAATLPNPLKYDSAHPSRYMLKRKSHILRLMRVLPKFPSDK
ncbi:MAG TPA: monofunctional biosynthetic peptidoglycan transglycosylase [Candidatus Limisoma gallistercoris]|jgi:monofunctional biosynthetic peptidoglycan transglycosylase|nr:monofunctional biosynthetic peptidoglycan transglycosylase [Candidatus Limisoma gallistercoris]